MRKIPCDEGDDNQEIACDRPLFASMRNGGTATPLAVIYDGLKGAIAFIKRSVLY